MKTILNILTKSAATIATLGTLSAVIWGGYKIYDTIIETKQLVEYVNIEQSMISQDILSLHDSLTVMKGDIQKSTLLSERLIWLEKNRKQFTPEQIDIILDEFIKKKSNTIPYGWILSDSIIYTENQTYNLSLLKIKP